MNIYICGHIINTQSQRQLVASFTKLTVIRSTTMWFTLSSLQFESFPFFSDRIEDLKLPSYLAKVDDVSSEVDKLEWWKKYSSQLPHWSAACKLILLVQPSSAAAERVFFHC